eukprot:6207195-Pleurochrysis_carterae.AAC.12
MEFARYLCVIQSARHCVNREQVIYSSTKCACERAVSSLKMAEQCRFAKKCNHIRKLLGTICRSQSAEKI